MNPEPHWRGGVHALKQRRTPMSNAHHHRARERHSDNDMNGAARAPVHGVVRPHACPSASVCRLPRVASPGQRHRRVRAAHRRLSLRRPSLTPSRTRLGEAGEFGRVQRRSFRFFAPAGRFPCFSPRRSNAHHQRARAAPRNQEATAERAPLHGAVRQRVGEPAAAPPPPRLQNRGESYKLL
jgi:hypothetical protein